MQTNGKISINIKLFYFEFNIYTVEYNQSE